MLYHNVKVLGSYLLVIDSIAIGVLSFIGLSINAQFNFVHSELGIIQCLLFCCAIGAFFLFLGSRMRAYHGRRTERIFQELIELGEVSIYAIALAALVCQVFAPELNADLVVYILLFDTMAMVSLRLVLRFLVRKWRRHGKDYRIWLIIGSGPEVAYLTETINRNPHFGIRLLEVLDFSQQSDIDENRSSVAGLSAKSANPNQRVLDNLERFKETLENNVVDEVLISLPANKFYDEIQQVLTLCREAGIAVHVPLNTYECREFDYEVTASGSHPMVSIRPGPKNEAHLAYKRVLDILGATLGLIVLSPFLLIIAIAIKLDSEGGVLYFSPRIGLNGRKFRMAKFRSMHKEADKLRDSLAYQSETNGLAFKIKDDPRITRVGKTLRAYHLDELPQLWNVLVGDMSLVGPRPLPEGEAPGEEWWQRRRLSVPPGLTCFWQIQGDHKMPFEEWAELDLKYIDNWSVWLDVKLIAMTMLIIFRRQGW